MTEYWLSTRHMTFWARVENGFVVDTAPIAKKFRGRPFERLEGWLRRQGGYRKQNLDVQEEKKEQ